MKLGNEGIQAALVNASIVIFLTVAFTYSFAALYTNKATYIAAGYGLALLPMYRKH